MGRIKAGEGSRPPHPRFLRGNRWGPRAGVAAAQNDGGGYPPASPGLGEPPACRRAFELLRLLDEGERRPGADGEHTLPGPAPTVLLLVRFPHRPQEVVVADDRARPLPDPQPLPGPAPRQEPFLARGDAVPRHERPAGLRFD